MTQEQLNKIIEKHQHYLNKDIDGWESMKADLSDKNLSGLDLRNANLIEADLSNASLSNSNLRNANLNNANLREANLYGANLIEADLNNADLIDADLNNACLRYANLRKACLRYANLRKADLRKADLSEADMYEADLSEADMYEADLKEANLLGTNLKNTNTVCAVINEDTKIDYPIACPKTGSFIGYKKAVFRKIVKLQICEDAKRSSATTKKCRCSKALVLAIENIDGSDSGLKGIASIYDPSFIYRVGKIAEVPDFDNNRWRECSPGIHFFANRQDAVEY
jgi:hypothetical protein